MNEKVPKGWKKVKLREIAIINPSESLKKGQIAKKVSMEMIRPFTKKIDFFLLERYNGGVKFKNGDTIVARITPSLENGKTAFIDFLENNEIGFGSTEFIVLRAIDEKSDKHFLYYFAISPEFRDIAIKSMTGSSGRQRVQTDVVKEYEFYLPPLPEQQAIADVLSSLDDKIDLLHRQNKTLEQMAETLFRKWFIEDAKEDWEEVKLGEVLNKIESGSRPKGGIDPNLKTGIPSIGAENINGLGNFDFSKVRYITNEFFKKIKQGIVQDYDVLIYKDGAYIGRKSMFGKGFPFKKFCVNEHVFILRVNDRLSQFFLYFLLNEEELRNFNTNSAQPGLNKGTMKNLSIILPPKNTTVKFDNFVKPLVDKIFLNGIQIRTLENLRDALLPKLMSGELRVKLGDNYV
ncbi:restriction endonuclease subunit S [Athalassotoga saccharophila]|uniref:restriction endonuclease subunit S n=1 Tax=Athalassotoga saccharophila TaxID=1441386 RepID=UPI00137A2638|nr:restriction endonuclease subunit S [Athalassotoga saccharophila]BBJ27431.1 type I restriction-modification system, specificity subunit S [Athalassotoga saccharophila]